MEWWIDWSQGKTNTHLKNVFVGKIKMLSRDYFCKIKMYLPRKTTTGIGKRSVSFSSVRDKHSRLERKIISSKFGNCISTPKFTMKWNIIDDIFSWTRKLFAQEKTSNIISYWRKITCRRFKCRPFEFQCHFLDFSERNLWDMWEKLMPVFMGRSDWLNKIL